MAKKVTINKDLCIGCGLCTSIAAGIFDFDDDGKAKVTLADGADVPAEAEDAAANCPVQAISIE